MLKNIYQPKFTILTMKVYDDILKATRLDCHRESLWPASDCFTIDDRLKTCEIKFWGFLVIYDSIFLPWCFAAIGLVSTSRPVNPNQNTLLQQVDKRYNYFGDLR
jgi:hypothetical protein